MGAPLGERARPNGLPLREGFSPSGRARGLGEVGGGLVGWTDTHTNGRKRGGKGASSPLQGGGRGRGLQAPAPARPRVPTGNGESLRRTPHAP